MATLLTCVCADKVRRLQLVLNIRSGFSSAIKIKNVEVICTTISIGIFWIGCKAKLKDNRTILPCQTLRLGGGISTTELVILFLMYLLVGWLVVDFFFSKTGNLKPILIHSFFFAELSSC